MKRPVAMNNGFEEWGGYMDAKITKLEEQFSAASNPYKKTDIFAGISIFVNGHTDPSADELKRIMMIHGGIFHHYERSHTTYIIASNLPDVKVRNMNTSKIISPQWVVDCIKEEKIIDYTKYLLYTNQKKSQPSISFIMKKKEEPNVSVISNTNEVDKQLQDNLKSINTGLQDLNAKMRQSLPTSADSTISKKDVSLNASSANSSNVARTAVDPKFLSEFYNNSRLHHIATLGAGFKQYVSELREQHGSNGFPARQDLKKRLQLNNVAEVEPFKMSRQKSCVMHIDMDCFFVSVGLRTHPHLKGHPVAVTHSKGGSSATEVPVHPNADRHAEMELFAKRFEQHLHNNILSDKVRGGFENKMSLSEIACASYEARAKGIRNGMFVGQALKLCPELKTIQYDFEGYREVAFTLYNTIAQYTLNIEAVSCDEMFVDLTEVLEELKVDVMDFVKSIREEVREKTQCPCSAGIGANKLQARMATKKAKPDGQYYLQCENVEAYMSEIPIQDLPGVGSSTAYTLKDANLITCGDLQKATLPRLQMLLGKKFGETLYQFCRGIDQRGLTYGQIRKSVSAEVNYGIRFKTYAELETFLKQLCEEVHNRLKDIKRKTKCVTLKLMVRAKEAPVETSKFMGHGVCDHITKSVSLSEFTNDLETITRCILTTMKALNLPPHELRGIGIQLTKLDDPTEQQEKPKENIIKNMFSKVKEKQKEAKAQDNKTEDKVFKEPAIKTDMLNSDQQRNKSPEAKKSPDAMKTVGTKRGRPKAAGSNKESKIKPNIMGMLKTAAAKQAQQSTNNNEQDIPEDIDPEVFNALPLDIREEILRERRKATNKTNKPDIDKKPAANKNTNQSLLNESDFLPSTSKAAQQKRHKKLQQKTETNQEQTMDVDPEFLAALPPELRAEIEQQLQLQKQSREHEQSYRPVTPPPSDNHYTVTKQNNQNSLAASDISSDNIFTQNNCIELLLSWLQSCDVPENYDVDLMCCNARELVRAKELDKLYESLLYLGRLIKQQKYSENDCCWHLAFKMILEAVQMEMLEVYDGRKLYMPVKLKCDKCKF
ncbi:DNA repair protein Rev1 [Calliphora vicina]|uniref:DNA repair protein Rev1 n=1 Tax=Calliphora vicina TaxID=7373 RepID=UPI00325A4C7A